ncbi:hypothetical protein IFM89_033954 [Coptis chinensis]|uniref:F-box domain-containing protein n=1 Tax=Coptis chinensis TaxID=261450 RepID=A0A835HX63_9MAGN|nr:hypothetical protein IFM89_033954 [Coptis chinensis]
MFLKLTTMMRTPKFYQLETTEQFAVTRGSSKLDGYGPVITLIVYSDSLTDTESFNSLRIRMVLFSTLQVHYSKSVGHWDRQPPLLLGSWCSDPGDLSGLILCKMAKFWVNEGGEEEQLQLSGDFPSDVLLGILSRLPLKSLSNFRWVCKTWYNAIHHPRFAMKHYVHALQNRSPCIVISVDKGVDYLVDHQVFDNHQVSTVPYSLEFCVSVRLFHYQVIINNEDVIQQRDCKLTILVGSLISPRTIEGINKEFGTESGGQLVKLSSSLGGKLNEKAFPLVLLGFACFTGVEQLL